MRSSGLAIKMVLIERPMVRAAQRSRSNFVRTSRRRAAVCCQAEKGCSRRSGRDSVIPVLLRPKKDKNLAIGLPRQGPCG